MRPLPSLANWERTSHSLHQAAMLLGAIRQLANPRELTNDAPLLIDAHASADYAQALDRVFTATARFRARLTGLQTPIVVWPEHFDLSFLWFATERATDEFPHMNFGF